MLWQQTITYALCRADVQVDDNDESGDIKFDTNSGKAKRSQSDADDDNDEQIRAQNQVGLIVLCELTNPDYRARDEESSMSFSSATSAAIFGRPKVDEEDDNRPISPPVIIATTHLKASKNLKGEKFRLLEANQLLYAVERAADSLIADNREPAIVITVSVLYIYP
jgi:hypothetical protein